MVKQRMSDMFFSKSIVSSLIFRNPFLLINSQLLIRQRKDETYSITLSDRNLGKWINKFERSGKFKHYFVRNSEATGFHTRSFESVN